MHAPLRPTQVLESSVPQMKHKGRLKVGADADIVVFDPEIVADRSSYERPALTSAGVRHVLVNGTPVLRDGELIRTALPGGQSGRPDR
jgi:N-acyl-D-glutamate deacylase